MIRCIWLPLATNQCTLAIGCAWALYSFTDHSLRNSFRLAAANPSSGANLSQKVLESGWLARQSEILRRSFGQVVFDPTSVSAYKVFTWGRFNRQ